MKKQKSSAWKMKLRRKLATFLAFVMTAGMIAEPYTALTVQAEDQVAGDKTISGLGTNGIGSPVPGYRFDSNLSTSENVGHDIAWEGSYVYYGKYEYALPSNASEVRPVKYRVLDPRTTRFSADGSTATMLLDCDTILCQEQFYTDCFSGGCNKWANSPIRTYLNGNEFYGNTSFFTALEKTSIAASTIATHHLGSYGNNVDVPMHGPTAANFQDYTALEGDHVFLLDAEDLSNTAYGYTNDAQGKNRDKIAPGLSDYHGDYWTRSAQHVSDNIAYRAGYVCGNVEQPGTNYNLSGLLNVKQTNEPCGVSPAFNVDLSKVVFSSPVASEENTYKLTLLDSNSVLSVNSGTVERGDAGYTVNVGYTLSYGDSNIPTRLSYVVTNGTWSDTGGWSADAEVLQYGEVIIVDGSFVNGTGSFSIAGTGLSGVWGRDYHVYLVAEDVNTVYATDYAGAPVEVKAVAADAEDVTVSYNGGGHGIRVSVAAPQNGVDVRYGETAGHCVSYVSPSYSAATGDSPKTVYYEASASGYLTMKGSAKVTIHKAPLTVKAKDKTITYGDAPANNGLECTGFMNNETVSVLSNVGYTYTYSQGDPVGEYAISPADTITADNYEITGQNGKLTVAKKEAGLSWSNTTLTYNGQIQAPTATATELYGTDSCTVTVSGGMIDVGKNYTASACSLSNSNYKLPSKVTVSFNIVPADPVVVLSANTLIYNTREQKLVTVMSVSGGTLYYAVTSKSNPAPDFDGTSSKDKKDWSTSIPGKIDGGDWRVWYKLKGDKNHNDSPDGQYIDVTIRKAPTKIVAEDRSVRLGETIELAPKLDVNAYAVFSFKSINEDIATVNNSGIVTGVAIGTATISINAITTDHDYEAPPYKTIKITVTDKDTQDNFGFQSATRKKTYGDSDFELAATGAAEGSTVSYNSSDPSVATIDPSTGVVHILKAGQTTIRAHASETDRYVSANAACVLTVGKRSATITALDKRIKVGDTVPDLSSPAEGTDYSVSGLLVTDSLSVNLLMSYPEAPDNTKEGSYTIRIDGPQEDQDKYHYTYVDGTLTIYEEIIVPPHSHSFTETITKDPTCTDTGVKTFYCAGCGYSYTASIPALGHDFTEDYTVTKEAACTVPGEESCSCNRCGEKKTRETKPLGHDFSGESTVVKEPGCTTPGEKSCRCIRCEEKETQEIEPLGHDFSGEYTVTKKPDCTVSGEKVCKCTRCSAEESLPIPAKGHIYRGWRMLIAPSALEKGVNENECLSCGQHIYADIPATGVPTQEEEQLIEDAGADGIMIDEEVIRDENGNEVGREVRITVSGQVVEKTVIGPDGEVTVETVQWTGGLKKDYHYNGGSILPDFRMYDGLTALEEGRDYSVTIKNNKKVGETAGVIISFKGDYKGLPDIFKEFVIDPADLGKDVEAGNAAVYANGRELTPMPDLTWSGSKKKVTKEEFNTKYRKITKADQGDGSAVDAGIYRTADIIDGVIPAFTSELPEYVTLGEETDSISEPGLYQVTVTPKNGNFTGSLTAAINMVGDKKLLLSEAKVKLTTKKFTWTGSPVTPAKDSYSLILNGQTLTEGTDYSVSFEDNVEPGKAAIIFTAIEDNEKGYAGSKTANFTIVKGRELKEDAGFSFECPAAAPYAKGGAKPAVTVKDGEEELISGVDYIVTYSKNTKVTEGATAAAIVKGKGKYKGSVKLYFAVTKQDIASLSGNIIVADKSESKKGYQKPTIRITDVNGKTLKSGTDYEIDAQSYVVTDPFGNVRKQDNAQSGDTITVTILGKGKNYEGSISVSYRYIKAAKQLGRVKAMKLASKSFNGREITLGRKDLCNILYTGSNKNPVYLEPGKDFIVESYENNTRTGTAKVTLRGVGDWGGTKTLSFKITPKK